ncbi:hypothetical protein OXYTRIMIC_323 [Oxytricha trifallax]|uniref:Ubiquitin-like protease family profile domain-containing protein n=1 Tax=Oxytricha trifallax TaxID=1172189 RepID=A0A073HZ67_9SPIT|nr:hypothetical protein OXYTRIMIC_323 [Oxytricha trifallax]
MNRTNFSKRNNEEEIKYERRERFENRGHYNKKRDFWNKVQEVRFNHRDRSKDQEAMGMRNEEHCQVPLNKQMGFKSRLKIGKTNPSKRINESQAQRVSFDKHADGSECIQKDQMKFKSLIDLSEVQCRGFDKIIYAKKGWTPMVTRMITTVCCPSSRTKIEKALVQRFDDRERARRKGVNHKELWSEKQHNHWREINAEWKHFDLIPGNHIQEETMEAFSRQIEEVQFSQSRQEYQILPSVVLNDNGFQNIEKSIGASNWKLENGKFWRYQDEIQGVVLPINCQGAIKNCQNWVVAKIERNSKKMEIYDSRRAIGSLAIIQKYQRQLCEFIDGTIGKEFKTNKIEMKNETNQVNDPQDCGVMAMLIINHLALELQGEPFFQIFAKDWINSQRYYTMFNLEVGYMKMQIGRSGMTLEEEEVTRDIERKSMMLWQKADEEVVQSMYNSHIDNWDDLVLGGAPKVSQDKEDLELQEEFGEMMGEVSEIENYMFNSKKQQPDTENDAEQRNLTRVQDEGTRGNATIKPKERKEGEERKELKEKEMNQEEKE